MGFISALIKSGLKRGGKASLKIITKKQPVVATKPLWTAPVSGKQVLKVAAVGTGTGLIVGSGIVGYGAIRDWAGNLVVPSPERSEHDEQEKRYEQYRNYLQGLYDIDTERYNKKIPSDPGSPKDPLDRDYNHKDNETGTNITLLVGLAAAGLIGYSYFNKRKKS